MNEFLDSVIKGVEYEVQYGNHESWIDLCVEFPIPERVTPGKVLVVWGEETEYGEKYFSVWLRRKGDTNTSYRVISDSDSLQDLRKTIWYAIQQLQPKKKTKPKKVKSAYKSGGPIWSLDVLADQEFVFFNGKLYHKGWFGSWQFMWIVVQLRRGSILYAIKEDAETEQKVHQT